MAMVFKTYDSTKTHKCFSFIVTFASGWKNDTSSFTSKSNFYAYVTTWDSSFSLTMPTQKNIT